jgi:predicted enzyme related to lactoylglutathione lyase
LRVEKKDKAMEQYPPTVCLDAVLFASPHPESLAAFYQQGFELEPPRYHGADHLGLNLVNLYLGFDRTKERTTTSQGTVSIWYKVPDIEEAFQRLVQLGAKVKYAPTMDESPGEILAMLYDLEGNSIGLISRA